jgi:hypothetical protein
MPFDFTLVRLNQIDNEVALQSNKKIALELLSSFGEIHDPHIDYSPDHFSNATIDLNKDCPELHFHLEAEKDDFVFRLNFWKEYILIEIGAAGDYMNRFKLLSDYSKTIIAHGFLVEDPASGNLLALEEGMSKNLEEYFERNDDLITPLHHSVYADISFLKFCIDRGAEINAVDIDGWTPLMWLARTEYVTEKGELLELITKAEYLRLGIVVENLYVNGDGQVVNFGTIEGNINSNLDKLYHKGQIEISESILSLVDVVKRNEELAEIQKKEYLDLLQLLSSEALKPKETRIASSILKNLVLQGLGKLSLNSSIVGMIEKPLFQIASFFFNQ